jgi:hypothetical protein
MATPFSARSNLLEEQIESTWKLIGLTPRQLCRAMKPLKIL